MIAFTTKIAESLSVHFKPFVYIKRLYYKRLIVKELRLLNLKSTSRVLFIGCGALPLSAQLLYEHVQASIDMVDYDTKMIKGCQRYLEKTKLPFKLMHCQAEGCPLKSYTHIIVAKQVHADETLINHLTLTAQPDTKILVRHGKNKHGLKGLTKQVEVIIS